MLHNPIVTERCKIGQAAMCCRYLVMSPNGWQCGKLTESLKRQIDARVVHMMVAKSDNCDGVPDLHTYDMQKDGASVS